MELKAPLSLDGQIDKLKRPGMIITDDNRVKNILSRINYYRFTGYALQFRQSINNSDYVGGLTFEKE